MRIVIACDWFLKYASEQAAALARAGHQVALVHRSGLGEFGGSRSEQVQCLSAATEAGVVVRSIVGSRRSPRAALDVARTYRWLSDWEPEVVHTHPHDDLWLYLLFSATRRRLGAPLLVTVHDPSPHPGTPQIGRVRTWLDAAVLAQADGIVVHGEELRRLTRPLARERPVWVVPHGIRVLEDSLPVPDAPCCLLFGRLLAYKGVGVLMRAMEAVWTQRPDVRLVVAGEGPAAAEVIDHPNIETHFGYVSEADASHLFRRASLVLAPYTEASQSGVVSLAIGQGIPVVVSDVGSLADIAVLPESVVPAGDPAALAAAILALVDHPSELRTRVLDAAHAEFSWDATAQEIAPFYAAFA